MKNNANNRTGEQRKPRLLSRRCFPAATWTCLLLLGVAFASEDRCATVLDPFKPTVTSEEAALLRDVSQLTASNQTSEAIALLKQHDLAAAGPALYFALGNLYFQTEDLKAAEKAYEAALRKLPKFRSALANLGRIYLLQDQTARAIEIYQSLVRDGQANADVLILLGHAFLLTERGVSAENAYRQALLLRPGEVDARLGLAKCLLQQERYREGNALLKELLADECERGELWSLLANTNLALDREDDAVVDLECARRLGLASPDMLADLGDLYLNRGQSEEAVDAYEQAFAIEEPSLARMLRAAEGFVMLEDTGRAERLLKQAATGKGKAPSRFDAAQHRKLLRLQGDIARLDGDTERAKTRYRELLKEDPLEARVLITLGDMHRQEGALEDAVMVYERAARISGYEARALVRQAQVEVERERYRKAVELLQAAQCFDEQPNVARYLEQVRRLARR